MLLIFGEGDTKPSATGRGPFSFKVISKIIHVYLFMKVLSYIYESTFI